MLQLRIRQIEQPAVVVHTRKPLCCLQDWTKLENEDSEGLVEVSYRSGSEPGRPPDIQVIQKQMAIVAWQPGPNRVVQVPTEVRQR